MRLATPAAAALAITAVFSSSTLRAQTAQPPAVQQMQQVENAWDAALGRRDQYALENVLSPQIVDIAATGDVTTRNQDLAKLFVKDALPATSKQTVIDVRPLAENIRIVNGTYVMHWPAAQGAPSGTPPGFDEKGIFTQVFQLVNDHWLCIASQRTVVAEQTQPAKSKAQTPHARSNAVEPFHIPLIYKGAQSAQPTPAPGSQPAPPN